MSGSVEGVVTNGWDGRRLYVDYKGQPHDCVIDAVVSLALRQGEMDLAVGQRLRVTVELVGDGTT